MTLQLGMLVPGAVGLCCTVADRRRRRVSDWLPALVMTIAMLDLALSRASGTPVIAPIGWALVLLIVAIVPAIAVRFGRHSAGIVDTVSAIQHSLGLLTMAGLAAMMGRGTAVSVAAPPHEMGAGMLPLVISGGVIAVGALTVWLVVRSVRVPRPLAAVNAASVFVGLMVMAAAMA